MLNLSNRFQRLPSAAPGQRGRREPPATPGPGAGRSHRAYGRSARRSTRVAPRRGCGIPSITAVDHRYRPCPGAFGQSRQRERSAHPRTRAPALGKDHQRSRAISRNCEEPLPRGRGIFRRAWLLALCCTLVSTTWSAITAIRGETGRECSTGHPGPVRETTGPARPLDATVHCSRYFRGRRTH